MNFRATLTISVCLLGLAAFAAGRDGVMAQDSEPEAAPPASEDEQAPPAAGDAANWTIILRQQAVADKRCEVREIIHFREFELGTDKAVEGRLACVDGREYDFSRARAHQPFKFVVCEPTVC